MAVINVLLSAAGLIKVRSRDKTNIDSPCGTMHYRWTATVSRLP